MHILCVFIESVEQFKEHWVMCLLEQDILTTAVLFYFVFSLILEICQS